MSSRTDVFSKRFLLEHADLDATTLSPAPPLSGVGVNALLSWLGGGGENLPCLSPEPEPELRERERVTLVAWSVTSCWSVMAAACPTTQHVALSVPSGLPTVEHRGVEPRRRRAPSGRVRFTWQVARPRVAEPALAVPIPEVASQTAPPRSAEAVAADRQAWLLSLIAAPDARAASAESPAASNLLDFVKRLRATARQDADRMPGRSSPCDRAQSIAST